jgi:hypothetical protein
MAKVDPLILAHLEWLGFVRPTGLVVSAPALVRAGAILDRRDAEGQRLLRACAVERTFDPKEGPVAWVPDFRAFAKSVLDWSFSPKGYAGTADSPMPAELEVAVAGHAETLRPDFAVREMEPQAGAPAWQLLVCVLEPAEDLDRVVRRGGGLEASAHGRLERLLRQTGVPAGLLFNGRVLRLLSAPRGESSGWVDFKVAEMVQTAGRPISTALRLLLSEPTLLALPQQRRLAALLADSRKFQSEVSERLAEQVLHALYELLRGFQAAHDASKGELLREALEEHPDEVYRALLTIILRLVFLLYAEERDMLPEDEAFLRYYSIAGLYERLREDAALFPDTMDQRFGAWAQLLVLFRMIHDGAESGAMRLPRRHGVLFDPDRFPFQEGRPAAGGRQLHERIEPPLVPDGTIYRTLEKLLVLDGERISYRALDVEEIGSVYQAMMGFRLETATGRSIAVKAQKKWSAPTTVDLDELLAVKPAERKKRLEESTDRRFTETVAGSLKDATTIDDLHAALLSVVDLNATPDIVPRGAMVLQPSQERRRSGSHYTPRALTEPIVRTTLEPILARLRGSNGEAPTPVQILDLKVCDPAMGSGAFLVEACRQLGDALIEAWRAHGGLPGIPPDEDELIYARRIVAQKCIYGVDRNPVAVDLAKVSLWLATLAKDHPLTFVDHSLRHGDSLIGLSQVQIEAFHWAAGAPRFQAGIETLRVREHLAKVSELRAKIRDAEEGTSDWMLRDMWDEAQSEASAVRLLGDLAVTAFVDGKSDKEREAKRAEYAKQVVAGRGYEHRAEIEKRRYANPPLAPLHWWVEFPEVFERANGGFDAIVGNPPFLGGRKISTFFGTNYLNVLHDSYKGARNLCDLAAYFFRRAFELLRNNGVLGLIATKTISEGDTRRGGLAVLCEEGGEIYSAIRRMKWPGVASSVVSRIHISKGPFERAKTLDGRKVERVSAFLLSAGPDRDPSELAGQNELFSKGTQIYGLGFLFDDTSERSTPLSEMSRIVKEDPRYAARIVRYIGGEDLNANPSTRVERYAIYLSDLKSEDELAKWPELEKVVRARVKPERDILGESPSAKQLKKKWWAYQAHRPEFYKAAARLERVLAQVQTSTHLAFEFLRTGPIFNKQLNLFLLDGWEAFAILQSRVHEIWADVFASTFGDAPVYTPSSCFATFPFPVRWQGATALQDAGRRYHEARDSLMSRNDQGLTSTYNRFHDPEEHDAEVLDLRERHAAMDRAILDAYGWTDIRTDCEFLLDYEIDEGEWGDKRKPWRYRWPDEVREEVLARLLEVNGQRAAQEARSGAATADAPAAKASKASAGTRKTAKRKPKDSSTGDLF